MRMEEMLIHFINQIANPVLLVNETGEIVVTNKSAEKIIQLCSMPDQLKVNHIDPLFSNNMLGTSKFHNRTLIIKNISFSVNVYKLNISNNDLAFLYIFDQTSMTSSVLDEVIENISEKVAIYDGNGVFLKGNKEVEKLVGRKLDSYVGQKVQSVINKLGIYNAVTPEAIKQKKMVEQKVAFSNGTVIHCKTTPIFNSGNELIKVIEAAKDVTDIVNLREELREVEIVKNEYLKKLNKLQKMNHTKKIIFASTQIEDVLYLASRVANTDSSVFITGESGVGKEEIAKYIHQNSMRSEMPFVAINCAAIPSELLESELFGYEEGAFSGAKKGGKKGLFEIANSGTIFLDEIGELPLKMQGKLLRVIQENNIKRLGGNDLIPIDIRYICATNLTKSQLKNEKFFRQDLYYRLSIVPICVPPLKDRKDDILPLINHFLTQFNQKYNRKVKINSEAMIKLYNYPWPGNVRELKNVVERIVILAKKNEIETKDLEIILHLEDQFKLENTNTEIQVNELMPLAKAYRIVDQQLISRAIFEHGTIVNAAKALNVNPSTIHRKLKRDRADIEE